ncbi:MAG: ATP-binding protein [Bacteroidales bacterium]|nr:ATP-binding protein [Bacteroidales bacterium]
MKFYDRDQELIALRKIEKISEDYAQMTVITGRRRIGKTTLIKKAFTKIPFVYFFVGKKSETLLCGELAEIIREALGEDIGEFTSLPRLLGAIMSISKRRNFTLVLDEFQNIAHTRDSIFSDIQSIWDDNKEDSHINLVICGSLYSKMKKIFDDKDEPLYGRATARLKIRPFSLATMQSILADYNPQFSEEDLLTFYMITGGVAKYVELLITRGAVTKDAMIRDTLSVGSFFLEEGQEMLRDEFGKDYGNYFSILSALATGETSRGEIKSYTGVEAGGYLDKLEKDFDIISRRRPYLAGEKTKNVEYIIADNFLNFWFRFIYRYRSAVEVGNLEWLIYKVLADYETYSGDILERFFRQKYAESGQYNLVTNYWKKDGKDEIDLIAVNDVEKIVVIGEVKRNPEKINMKALKEKAVPIVQHHNGKWTIRFVGLSMQNMLITAP